MIEQAITNTKIIRTEHLSAKALNKLIFYCTEESPSPCIIHDNNALPVRDEMINDLQNIIDIEIQNRVFPDPKVSDIMEMVNHLKNKKINVVIGIGGGSTLDSAKAISAILDNGGDLDDYLGGQASRQIKKRNVKLILIPTTAGTGSEVTKVGVYTSRSGRKYTLAHPLLQADVAMLSAELTYSLPPSLTAATAFDALSHALETLWNKNATPLSDRLAKESAIHILKWMETAYNSSVDGRTAGRAELQEGACMAGIAFNLTGTAAVHALSFILSEQWHIPHGTACAFSLEDIFELNCQDLETGKKLASIARELFNGDKDDELLAQLKQKMVQLKRKFQLPFSMKDLGIELSENQISHFFDKSLDDPKMANNIISINEETVFDIMRKKL